MMRLLEVVERLAAARQREEPRHIIESTQCVRVGRNDVWRLTHQEYVVFVTYCRNEGEFQRRLTGCELAQTLASHRSDIAAGRLEGVLHDHLAIIVRRVDGVPVDHLFKMAYRIDKNPFRRERMRRPFSRALEGVLVYMRAFHEARATPDPAWWNHRPDGVHDRVSRHLERLSRSVHAFEGLPLRQVTASTAPTFGPVVGDATLGNFFFDGIRTACVDFEDVGIGELRRDLVVLSDSMTRALRQRHYWSADVEGMVAIRDRDDLSCSLYAVEPQLLRVLREIECSPRGRLRVEIAEALRRIRRISNDG